MEHRREEAHRLLRAYTDVIIATDDKGLPVLQRPTPAPMPTVLADWVEGDDQREATRSEGKRNGARERVTAVAAVVRCPACAKEFGLPSKARKKALIAAGSGTGGALIGGAVGASYGAGLGIAGGGVAMAATAPLGIIGGVIGGGALAIGGKLGANWVLAKVTCPHCETQMRVKASEAGSLNDEPLPPH